jgi:hypothetical protein
LWELIGNIGGSMYLLLLIFGAFVAPIAKHGFKLRAIKRLYWARTNDPELFRPKKRDEAAEQKMFKDLLP